MLVSDHQGYSAWVKEFLYWAMLITLPMVTILIQPIFWIVFILGWNLHFEADGKWISLPFSFNYCNLQVSECNLWRE